MEEHPFWGTLACVYIACVIVMIIEIVTDKEPDMTWGEKVFYTVLAPFSIVVMILHDLKEHRRLSKTK